MELTQEHFEVASDAYFAGLDGNGIVIHHHAYPAAHELAEQGWLERRMEDNGDLSWWWTAEAEGALDVSRLLRSAEGREN